MDGDQKFALCVIGAFMAFFLLTMVIAGVVDMNKPQSPPTTASPK